MLGMRIITVIVGIPLIAGLLFLGGWFWHSLFIAIAVVGLYEYLKMLENADIKPMFVSSYLLLVGVLAGVWIGAAASFLLFVAIIVMIGIMVWRFPRYNFSDVIYNFFGAFYIAFNLSWAMRLESNQQAFALMLLIFILTWSSDIGGYIAGRLWGQRKLAPELSPNKTREGALGGLVLSVLLAMIYCYCLPMLKIGPGMAALLGLFGSVAAQLGDLFMSGIKRYCEVKDSGKIIPGHGGVLDRFDSFLLVVPTMYFFLWGQGHIVI